METMSLPPFERLYLAHRDDVHASLRRLLGRDRADDAFQETFLRALRAYERLQHGRELRAWAYTIASRVAVDELRRRRPEANPPEQESHDARPAYAELDDLTGALPPKERAA